MNLCILTHIFPARSETFVIEHVLGMARRGHSVTVLARTRDSSVSESELKDLADMKVTIIYLGEHNSRIKNFFIAAKTVLRHPTALGLLLRPKPWTLSGYLVAFRAAEIINKLQPNLVHIHFGTHAARLQRLTKYFAKFPPIIVTWHGYDANAMPRSLGEDIFRELFAADVPHTVGSHFMRRRIQKLGARPDRISIIPMGIDLKKFPFHEKSMDPAKPLQILSVGRLDEVKGHSFLIDAVKILQESQYSIILRIIGEGSLRGALQIQIHEADLQDRVELVGAIPSADVSLEMQGADIFALTGTIEARTGKVESQGVVFAEAQATGLPVIACDVGGVAESIIDRSTGILCPPRNPQSIAKAIAFFGENRDDIPRYGMRGRHLVEERFSITVMLSRFEDIYHKIVQ